MAARRWREPRRAPHLFLLASWIAGASAAILIQRYSYGSYHFLLLIVPLGLLAICGAEAALDRLELAGRSQARAAELMLLALLLVACVPVGSKALALYRAHTQPEGLGAAYRRILMPSYDSAQRAAAVISGDSARPGAAFVFAIR